MKLPVAVLPVGSAAVTSTVVVPTGKAVPEAGLVVTVTAPLSSVAVGVGNVTDIEVAVEFGGSVTTTSVIGSRTGVVMSSVPGSENVAAWMLR